MEFCECGSLMMPAKDETGKRILKCRGCGKVAEIGESKMTEAVKHDRDVEVVDKEIETLPVVKEKCPKCGHGEANYWLQQTRAGDEPETKFLKCKKCKHTWRDYD